MTSAVSGPGWILKHAGTTIAEVLDIDGPEQEAETDEVTNQSSPSNYKEYISTLLDGGDVKFKCNRIPGDSSQAGLLTALQGRGLEAFTLDDPNSVETISFDARVKKWGTKYPVGKAATLDITLKITGPVTIA